MSVKGTIALSILISLLLSASLQAGPRIPALHSLALDKNNLVFEVTSYGCSRDKDFELQARDGISITLVRIRADRCKRAPMVITIKRSLKLLQEKYGLAIHKPFAVRNPFSAPPGKQHPLSGRQPSKNRAIIQ